MKAFSPVKWTERLEISPGAFERKIRADHFDDVVRGSNLLDHFRRDRSHARLIILPRLVFEAMPNLRSATAFQTNTAGRLCQTSHRNDAGAEQDRREAEGKRLARGNQTPYNLDLCENEPPDPGVDMFSRDSARACARGNS